MLIVVLESLPIIRRVQLGGYQQGIDYTYTVEGWLKAINHPDTSGNSDPGADIALSMSSALGPDGYETSLFRRDVFAEALFYYNGDFARPSSQFNNNTTTFLQDGTDLYNGNIRCWQTYIPTPYPGPTGNYYEQQNTGFKYVYDNNNRLTQTKFYYYNYGTGNWLSGGQYNETFSYSANGNIGAMGRFRATPSLTAQSTIEGGLSTQAGGFYNRPGHFTNALGAGNIPAPEAHPADFTYNANGELTGHDDDSSENLTITWTPYGKVHSITDNINGFTTTYWYDGMGNRMKKQVTSSGGGSPENEYYINSADGKLFATYAETGSSGMSVTERHLYGLEHLGIMRGANTYSTGLGAIDSMGDIDYEVHDHLGNVRVTFRDNNVIPHPYRPEMKSYYNYYAYGSPMPNRCWNALDYPNSFNGQRMNNVIGVGNLLNFKERTYNTRLGIFWSMDQLYDKVPGFSPYTGMGANPIYNVDRDGNYFTGDQRYMGLVRELYILASTRANQGDKEFANVRDMIKEMDESDVEFNLNRIAKTFVGEGVHGVCRQKKVDYLLDSVS